MGKFETTKKETEMAAMHFNMKSKFVERILNFAFSRHAIVEKTKNRNGNFKVQRRHSAQANSITINNGNDEKVARIWNYQCFLSFIPQ